MATTADLLQQLIDAGYRITGPGGASGWDASAHGATFHIPETNADDVVATALNFDKLYDKLTTMQQLFQDNYTAWPTMTAQQKDTANRNAQRGLANLVRHVRADLTSDGI